MVEYLLDLRSLKARLDNLFRTGLLDMAQFVAVATLGNTAINLETSTLKACEIFFGVLRPACGLTDGLRFVGPLEGENVLLIDIAGWRNNSVDVLNCFLFGD